MLLLAQQLVDRQEKGIVGTPEELDLESWNEKIKAGVWMKPNLWEYRNWVHTLCFPMELPVLLQSS